MTGIWPRLKKKFARDTRRRKLSGERRKADSNWDVNASTSGPEIVVLRCAVPPGDDRSMLVEYAERFGVAEAGFKASVSECEAVEVEKLSGGSEGVCASEYSCVENLERDSENSSEVRELQGNDLRMKMASSAAMLCVALPGKTHGCSVKKRRRPRWRQSSNSAFVVLVAIGAFLSSRFGHVGNPFAATLTLNAVIRVLHKGKLYARLVFSSVALYFLNPLRSYLPYCPRRLGFLPRKLKVITDTQSCPSIDEASRKRVIDVPQEVRSSSLEVSVLPLESAPLADIKRGTPSLVVTIPESSTSTESVPATVVLKKSGASGTSRRLAKKFASRFKKLKMFRSSSSASPSVSLLSVSERSLSPPHSGTHFTASSAPGRPISPSSPDKHWKCPFQKTKPNKSSELSEPHTLGEGTLYTIDEVPSGSNKTSTETLEQHHSGEIAASTNNTTSRCATTEDAADAPRNVSWPGVGLLVTLLFLLVGRIPAIMATSLFVLVVSNTHYDRTYPRVSRNDKQALEAARKLYQNPAPHGSRHPGSPPRRR